MTPNPTLSLDMFDFDLPPSLIAQRPAETRPGSRLLHLHRQERTIGHHGFQSFPGFLREGDLLVLNDTKVFPARLKAARGSGGAVEVFLLRFPEEGDGDVPCYVRPGKRIRAEETIILGDGSTLELRRAGDGFTVSGGSIPLTDAVEKSGKVPLPPYIRREAYGPDEDDRERYQTVYAVNTGAVAAPTAGLHFDEELLGRIRKTGVSIATVTLHVGPGTFQPVRVRDVSSHRMDTESYAIPEETAELVQEVKTRGGRVIAVGTTVVRTLESAFDGRSLRAGKGTSGLFIYPGFNFSVVDALLTNFHLPRSTLLMLVCAFAGTEFAMDAYREAVREKYRFYSYGDAMFIE